MRHLLSLGVAAFLTFHGQTPSYTIDAIRYATIRDFALSGLVMGAPAKPESTSRWWSG